VGNVLYVVGFEDGACWGCNQGQRTTIISLNVANPASIAKIDELSFDEPNDRAYSWRRSITVTDQRMYVAGPEYGSEGAIGSLIQVVDIADPGGDLALGATVQAAGMISSRWQMDEYEGVLRVISQNGEWRPQDPPRIQTFSVQSTQVVKPLATRNLIIPEGEDLRSVRFDGPRGYAITALQTDPLFTIDFSNPAAPVQAGELVIPGWVYHMEPRGERVLGLGFDQNNPEGGLNVSLFDVSNLAAPKMLDRVNFGGDWAWVSEDQDRIHKAFNVLDAEGLILMPFSGWSRSATPDACGGTYQTGVQLIDWSADRLALRGVAPAVGQARRGFLHGQRLFAVSDERVESFDVSDRSAPVKKASLALAHNVTATVPAGDKLVRVAQNWWTNAIELDVTRVADAESPSALGRLEIPGVELDRCSGGSWLSGVLGTQDRAYVIYNQYDYSSNTQNKESTRVLTVDLRDPAAPKGIGDALLEFGQNLGYYPIPGAVDRGVSAVVVGSALVFLETKYDYTGGNGPPRVTSAVRVVNMADPSQPTVTTLPLDTQSGTTGLYASGNRVAVGRYAKSSTAGRVRFYADRFDLSDASNPERLPSLNVPGSLVAYDASAERAFTADYRSVSESLTHKACYGKYAHATFVPDNGVWSETAIGTCSGVVQSLRLVEFTDERAVLRASLELGAEEAIGNTALGEDRLFVTLQRGGYAFGPGLVDCFDCPGIGWSPVSDTKFPVLTLSGLQSGDFAFGRLELAGGDSWGYAPLAAKGTRAVVSSGWRGKLMVIDAEDVAHPTLLREEELFGNAQQLTIAGDVGIAAMGYDGVQSIELAD
jgi:hypothetical protein